MNIEQLDIIWSANKLAETELENRDYDPNSDVFAEMKERLFDYLVWEQDAWVHEFPAPCFGGYDNGCECYEKVFEEFFKE